MSKRIPTMGEVLFQIQHLVQSGQASPHDIDERGRTVFDVSNTSFILDSRLIPLWVYFDRNYCLSDETEPTNLKARNSFFKSLCCLGFPPNKESNMGLLGEG